MAADDRMKNLRGGAVVKNTFLEFREDPAIDEGDEDPWLISTDVGPRRLQTDSIVDRSSRSLRFELEQNIFLTLQNHMEATYTVAGASSRLPSAADLGDAATDLGALPKAKDVGSSGLAPKLPCRAPAGAAASLGGVQPWSPRRQKSAEDEPEPTPAAGSSVSSHSMHEGNVSGEDTEGADDISTPFSGVGMFATWPGALTSAGSAGTSAPLGPDPQPAPDFVVPLPASTVQNASVAAVALLAGAAPSGLNGATTIMVRNIPCKYTQRKLMREINGAGFLGHFDFIYLPMDPRSRVNRGFVFINFGSPEVAELFFHSFSGKTLRHFSSENGMELMAADIQGFETNAEHYVNARSVRRGRDSQSKPLFLRQLPSHLLAEGKRLQMVLDDPEFAPVPQSRGKGRGPGARLSSSPLAATASQDFASQANQVTQAQMQPPTPMYQVSHSAPSPLPAAQANDLPRFCPYCGKPKQHCHLFCPFCGAQMPQTPAVAANAPLKIVPTFDGSESI